MRSWPCLFILLLATPALPEPIVGTVRMSATFITRALSMRTEPANDSRVR